MKFLLLSALFISNLALAQNQQLPAGGSTRVSCAPGSTIVTNSVNKRSVDVYCQTTCFLSVMTESDLARAQGRNVSWTGITEYVIVATLPDGTLAELTNSHQDRALVISNLPRMADHVVEKGYCDRAVIN